MLNSSFETNTNNHVWVAETSFTQKSIHRTSLFGYFENFRMQNRFASFHLCRIILIISYLFPTKHQGFFPLFPRSPFCTFRICDLRVQEENWPLCNSVKCHMTNLTILIFYIVIIRVIGDNVIVHVSPAVVIGNCFSQIIFFIFKWLFIDIFIYLNCYVYVGLKISKTD